MCPGGSPGNGARNAQAGASGKADETWRSFFCGADRTTRFSVTPSVHVARLLHTTAHPGHLSLQASATLASASDLHYHERGASSHSAARRRRGREGGRPRSMCRNRTSQSLHARSFWPGTTGLVGGGILRALQGPRYSNLVYRTIEEWISPIRPRHGHFRPRKSPRWSSSPRPEVGGIMANWEYPSSSSRRTWAELNVIHEAYRTGCGASSLGQLLHLSQVGPSRSRRRTSSPPA